MLIFLVCLKTIFSFTCISSISRNTHLSLSVVGWATDSSMLSTALENPVVVDVFMILVHTLFCSHCHSSMYYSAQWHIGLTNLMLQECSVCNPAESIGKEGAPHLTARGSHSPCLKGGRGIYMHHLIIGSGTPPH